MKVAEFVFEQCQRVNQLIVQSEFASSQLTAIAETIGDWTGAFLERGDVWPAEHKPTKASLEMAFDAFEISAHVSPRATVIRSSEDRHVQQLIDFVCSLAKVALIASSRIQECYTVTKDRVGDIDATLGVCLDQGQRRYEPRDNDSGLFGETVNFDLQTILASCERRVCCHGGCPTCLEALRRWDMPFCLSVIFDQRHLPPTFEHVLEAGGNWAIIASRKMMGRVKNIAGRHGKVQVTLHDGEDFGLITIGDATVCDALHGIYRWR